MARLLSNSKIGDKQIESTEGAQAKANAAESNAKNASIPKSDKGVANGVAKLNAAGKVVDAAGNEVEGKVTSVNGQVGDVTITKSSIGLSNVDNIKQAPKSEFDTHKVAIASPTTLGHMKVGNNLSVRPDGTLDAKGGEQWETPVSITLSSSITGTLTFQKSASGLVSVMGSLNFSTEGTSALVGTVPVELRPEVGWHKPIWTVGIAIQDATINLNPNNGELRITSKTAIRTNFRLQVNGVYKL